MKVITSDWLRDNIRLFKNKHTVFITGAGISVASGIPDFRSKTGIFNDIRNSLKINGSELFTYRFSTNPATRKSYLKYISKLKLLVDQAMPSLTHKFISAYADVSKKCRVYTQNIDGLEEKAGMKAIMDRKTKLVYLHGNLNELSCLYCGHKIPFTEVAITKLSNGCEIPCEKCIRRRASSTRTKPIGYMHTSIIHYQQPHNNSHFIGGLVHADTKCDILIVMGTSLKVCGVKSLLNLFAAQECKRIYVNLELPANVYKNVFDFMWQGDCEEFCSILSSELGLDTFESAMKRLSISKTTSENSSDSSRLTDLSRIKNEDRAHASCSKVLPNGINISSRAEQGENKVHNVSARIVLEPPVAQKPAVRNNTIPLYKYSRRCKLEAYKKQLEKIEHKIKENIEHRVKKDKELIENIECCTCTHGNPSPRKSPSLVESSVESGLSSFDGIVEAIDVKEYNYKLLENKSNRCKADLTLNKREIQALLKESELLRNEKYSKPKVTQLKDETVSPCDKDSYAQTNNECWGKASESNRQSHTVRYKSYKQVLVETIKDDNEMIDEKTVSLLQNKVNPNVQSLRSESLVHDVDDSFMNSENSSSDTFIIDSNTSLGRAIMMHYNEEETAFDGREMLEENNIVKDVVASNSTLSSDSNAVALNDKAVLPESSEKLLEANTASNHKEAALESERSTDVDDNVPMPACSRVDKMSEFSNKDKETLLTIFAPKSKEKPGKKHHKERKHQRRNCKNFVYQVKDDSSTSRNLEQKAQVTKSSKLYKKDVLQMEPVSMPSLQVKDSEVFNTEKDPKEAKDSLLPSTLSEASMGSIPTTPLPKKTRKKEKKLLATAIKNKT